MSDTKTQPVSVGEGGLHLDGDKPRVDMFDPTLLLAAGEIWAQNNQPRDGYSGGKYLHIHEDIPNYQAGIKTMKLYGSIMRHLLKWAIGEDIDQDSGYHHLAHVECCLHMLWWILRERPDLANQQGGASWLSAWHHLKERHYRPPCSWYDEIEAALSGQKE